MSYQPGSIAGYQQPVDQDPDAVFRKGTNTVVRASIDVNNCRDATPIATTGIMFSQSIMLYQGDVITSIATRSGSTGAVTPTNWWFALYDTAATPALIGQTANQLTAAWAASTTKDLALTGGPFTMTRTGLYFVSIMMTAATLVNLTGQAANAGAGGAGVNNVLSGIVAGMVPVSQTSGSALTTTAPATITGGTAATNSVYMVAH